MKIEDSGQELERHVVGGRGGGVGERGGGRGTQDEEEEEEEEEEEHIGKAPKMIWNLGQEELEESGGRQPTDGSLRPLGERK